MNDSFRIDDPSPRQIGGVFAVAWIVKILAVVALLNLLAENSHGQQNPNVSNLVIVGADGSNYVLPALNPTADNLPALKAAVDWCEANAGRETLRIPPGVWKISAPFELVSDVDYQCENAELAPLDPATFQRSVILAGSSDHPSGGGTRPRADKVSITGLTIRQTAATSASSHGMFANTGDDWRLTRVKCIGSKHEGMVSGGLTVGWIWDRCEAEDCGAGSPFRTQSGAGINCNGMNHIVKDCICRRCGQSYEHAGNQTIFLRCFALDGLIPAGAFIGPAVGFNCGNGSFGLCRTRLIDCKSTKHPLALGIGNVLGRCSGIVVENFQAEDGGIAFSGGKSDNNVPTPFDLPDGERSRISGKVSLSSANGGMCFSYNSGTTAADGAIYGRAPVDFIDCVASIPTGEPDWMANAPFEISGSVLGDVVFLRPVITGPRGSSKTAGDFRLQANGSNSLPARVSNIAIIKPRAFKADGTERFGFVQYRGAPE